MVRKPVLDPADVTCLGLETGRDLLDDGWLAQKLPYVGVGLQMLTASGYDDPTNVSLHVTARD